MHLVSIFINLHFKLTLFVVNFICFIDLQWLSESDSLATAPVVREYILVIGPLIIDPDHSSGYSFYSKPHSYSTYEVSKEVYDLKWS